MAKTASERSRVLRERRACGKVALTVGVGEDELAEIGRAGYAQAASTDRNDREAAVSLFLSDAVRRVAVLQPKNSSGRVRRHVLDVLRGRTRLLRPVRQH
jgi:hypothetical protein